MRTNTSKAKLRHDTTVACIVAIILLVGMALSVSYINTLLASVGVIGLAISIGAKDIISDVFGGISLIFEKVFQVGDTVEVDGVRGKVIELGARTLKLIDEEGNLRVLRNGEIHKITNLSNQKTASHDTDK